MNLFFENSTRTRTTFEAAAKRLSANVLNIDIARSSTSKGETLKRHFVELRSDGCGYFVVRHSSSGAAHFIAQTVCPHVAIINAGDGRHAHPTQAMLDMLTIRRETKRNLKIFQLPSLVILNTHAWRVQMLLHYKHWVVKTFA